MTLQRSTVLDALFALVSSSAGYATSGRRLVPWNDQIAMPAIFQRQTGEVFEPLSGYGLPQKIVMDVEVWIYCKTGGPADTPEDAILPLLDALDTALAANTTFPEGRQTLGLAGYVDHAWREGDTVISQGEGTTTAVVVVPMKVSVISGFGSP
jgi:hypothetical protein